MKFKLDENLPAAAGKVLSDGGHDVSTALQDVSSGSSSTLQPEQEAEIVAGTPPGGGLISTARACTNICGAKMRIGEK